MVKLSKNAAAMDANPPSAKPRAVAGPDDGSAWRAANGQRSIEREQINGK